MLIEERIKKLIIYIKNLNKYCCLKKNKRTKKRPNWVVVNHNQNKYIKGN